MNNNFEEDYSKLKLLNNVLSGMQVNYFFIILMVFTVIWAFPTVALVILAIINQSVNPDIFVIGGILLFLIILIPVSLKLGKKKSYLNIALNNCKQFKITTDLQHFAEEVEASLKKELVYKSHLLVATDEYLLLWGDNDLSFNPIIVPRELIVKTEVVYRKKGIYTSNRRTNVVGVFTLKNNLIIEALLCGQFEKRAMEKLQKCKIV